MYIVSQDRDTIFTLTDKGLFKGLIYTDFVYNEDDEFRGCNIYGKSLFKTVLLGTYDTEEAEQIIAEIYKLLKAGEQFYSMPEVYIELEDMGVTL